MSDPLWFSLTLFGSLSEQMRNGDWDWNRPGTELERVITEDGQRVSLDNRRLQAAQETGQEQIPFRDHNANDILPDTWLKDPFWMKHGCKTWGDVLKVRLKNNRLPANGTSTPPTKG